MPMYYSTRFFSSFRLRNSLLGMALLFLSVNACTPTETTSVLPAKEATDAESVMYELGEDASGQKVYLRMEGFGISSHGCDISVLRETQGNFQVIQSFFALPDSLPQDSTQAIQDLNLYYRDLLFEGRNPVSVNYRWNGSRYAFNGLNYVVSSSDIRYTEPQLRLLGIVSDEALSDFPPFLTNDSVQAAFDINEMEIDTVLQSGKTRYLVIKNKYLSYGMTNKIWIVEEKNNTWLLQAEAENPEFAYVSYEYLTLRGQHYPKIYLGATQIIWR